MQTQAFLSCLNTVGGLDRRPLPVPAVTHARPICFLLTLQLQVGLSLALWKSLTPQFPSFSHPLLASLNFGAYTDQLVFTQEGMISSRDR